MPLPIDEKILALSNDLLQAFENIFGQHPGFRPAHAKGICWRAPLRLCPLPLLSAVPSTSPPHLHPSPCAFLTPPAFQ